MSVSLLLQYVVIALVVVVSVLVVVRKYLPGTWSRVCTVLAWHLTRSGRPLWIQRFGHRLVPEMRRVGACHRCGNCTSDSRRC
ncbi:hypothetical protein FUT69_01330 [Xylella taiwanensis]|uniref:Uncharacterized protein n=1 Tax=Xylella taiwanensis TaxID=1444770 RepID=Z9JKV5_9GAMM|nr:DUF6587 family protein [Xylella taiwanensis]AXI84228.1 hypothetical protein AB672_09905 [Xylella taiwanensis]EWS78829.1 hypothetical protein AF72_02910 [Xylella taiwanensis]MCD8457343.1 hypothetical protein [Xylella taiwanensis]MCD8459755.1 hypothetical protein [Xylella taiwanensis]MCD8461376.1 hypothetical protein [Xylella taiwanensis]